MTATDGHRDSESDLQVGTVGPDFAPGSVRVMGTSDSDIDDSDIMALIIDDSDIQS